jgi:hypothetical protein
MKIPLWKETGTTDNILSGGIVMFGWRRRLSKVTKAALLLITALIFQACAESGSFGTGSSMNQIELQSQLTVPQKLEDCHLQYQESYRELILQPVMQVSCSQCHGAGQTYAKPFMDTSLSAAVTGFENVGEIRGILAKFRSGTHPGGSRPEESMELLRRRSTWDSVSAAYQQCLNSFGG